MHITSTIWAGVCLYSPSFPACQPCAYLRDIPSLTQRRQQGSQLNRERQESASCPHQLLHPQLGPPQRVPGVGLDIPTGLHLFPPKYTSVACVLSPAAGPTAGGQRSQRLLCMQHLLLHAARSSCGGDRLRGRQDHLTAWQDLKGLTTVGPVRSNTRCSSRSWACRLLPQA